MEIQSFNVRSDTVFDFLMTNKISLYHRALLFDTVLLMVLMMLYIHFKTLQQYSKSPQQLGSLGLVRQ